MVFPRDAVRTSGEVSVFHSSEHGRRYACASCQTPVYSHYDHAYEIDLYPGAFDEPGAFPPTYELWISRREPWLPEFPSVIHRYPKNRKCRAPRAIDASRQLTRLRLKAHGPPHE